MDTLAIGSAFGKSSIDSSALERAADVLQRGGLVAYPTDTVYGLAAIPDDDDAVTRLFVAKMRRADLPVPLLITSSEGVPVVATAISTVARRLMDQFWPGALTIVLPKAPNYHRQPAGDTVALRVPDHPVPRELSRLVGGPITGTSANVSGGPEPLTAGNVRSQLGDAVELVLDGGPCPGGTPSTVVDCTVDPPRIIRQGAVSRDELVRAANAPIQ